jgi:hypothetical protein
MGTAAAFLACYRSLCFSAPGKPSDPGIPSEFLPAEPGIQQGASRRSHVLVHVDPRDALIHHFHLRGHLLQRHPPPDGNRRAARQSPGSVQETDTRARSSSGGYPSRGLRHRSNKRPRTVHAQAVTTGGTSVRLCTFRPARRCGSPQRTPVTPRPAPRDGARDPVSVTHGSATQRRMISNNGPGLPRTRAERQASRAGQV